MISLTLFSVLFFTLSLLLLAVKCEDEVENVPLAASSRIKAVYQHISDVEMSKCQNTMQDCYSCVNSCPSEVGSEQHTRLKQRLEQADAVREVNECHAEYLKYRAGLPDWCLNRGTEFFTSEEFEPTEKVCGIMNKVECTEQWMRDLELEVSDGSISKSSFQYKLGAMALEYVKILEAIENEKSEIHKIPYLEKEYENERRAKLAEEAGRHLHDPSRGDTKFSNPVYEGIQDVKTENRKWDLEISRNDVYRASIENIFTRRKTVEKMPGLLESIARLENRVHSKRRETDGYIRDIKKLSEMTAQLEGQTTTLMYERSHSKDADKTVQVLDQELLGLYNALKEEREILGDLHVKGTEAKSELLGVMRQLVEEISKQQQEMGCRTTDFIFK